MNAPLRRAVVAIVIGGMAVTTGTVHAASLPLGSQHLTTFSTCSLVIFPKTVAGESDTWADQKNPTTNNGTAATVNVAAQTTGTNQRGFYLFTLSSCLVNPPSTVTVLSATLNLFVKKLPPSCRTYDIFRVTAGWTETGLTWNNQPGPATTASNTPASSTRTSSMGIGSVSTCANHTASVYAGFDVTTDVAAFLAGTAGNDGWMIRDDAEDAASNQPGQFGAREANLLTQPPELLITYARG